MFKVKIISAYDREKLVVVTPDNQVLKYYRVNKVAPNNTVVRGEWR